MACRLRGSLHPIAVIKIFEKDYSTILPRRIRWPVVAYRCRRRWSRSNVHQSAGRLGTTAEGAHCPSSEVSLLDGKSNPHHAARLCDNWHVSVVDFIAPDSAEQTKYTRARARPHTSLLSQRSHADDPWRSTSMVRRRGPANEETKLIDTTQRAAIERGGWLSM